MSMRLVVSTNRYVRRAAEDGLEHRHNHQENAQHLQGIDAVLHDHLVDDDLHHQRVGQAKQLHKEGGHKHLQQHPLVLRDGGPEPLQAKLLLGGFAVVSSSSTSPSLPQASSKLPGCGE
jgi:hypothetical protein